MDNKQKFHYLSVPHDSSWTEIQVLDGVYKDSVDENGKKIQTNLDDYIVCVENDAETWQKMRCAVEKIKRVVENYYSKMLPSQINISKDATAYWVTLNYSSHIKTIHVKLGKAPNQYNCNGFVKKEDADCLKGLIVNVLNDYGLWQF